MTLSAEVEQLLLDHEILFHGVPNPSPSGERIRELLDALLRRHAVLPNRSTLAKLDLTAVVPYRTYPMQPVICGDSFQVCSLCHQAKLHQGFGIQMRNCSACQFCPTCVAFYAAHCGLPADTGMWNKKRNAPHANLDCPNHVPVQVAKGRQTFGENTPTREELDRVVADLLSKCNVKNKKVDHSVHMLTYGQRTQYVEHHVPMSTRENASVCAFCCKTQLPNDPAYKLRARNCKRCAMCPTCVSFYCNNVGHSEEPGYYMKNDPTYLCYDVDCPTRVRGVDSRGRKPQCACRGKDVHGREDGDEDEEDDSNSF